MHRTGGSLHRTPQTPLTLYLNYTFKDMESSPARCLRRADVKAFSDKPVWNLKLCPDAFSLFPGQKQRAWRHAAPTLGRKPGRKRAAKGVSATALGHVLARRLTRRPSLPATGRRIWKNPAPRQLPRKRQPPDGAGRAGHTCYHGGGNGASSSGPFLGVSRTRRAFQACSQKTSARRGPCARGGHGGCSCGTVTCVMTRSVQPWARTAAHTSVLQKGRHPRTPLISAARPIPRSPPQTHAPFCKRGPGFKSSGS